MAWAALTGPMPRRSISPGARSLTMVCSWARLALSARAASRRARARRRISACRTACSRLASRGRSAPGQAGQAGVGERAAGELAVGVVAGQQQRAQPVGLRGAGGGEFLAGAEQDPQRLPVAVGARGGQPVGVQAQRGQHGQVGVDRVGLAPPAAGLAVGLLALDHDSQAGGGQRAGQPDRRSCGCPRCDTASRGPGAWSTIQASSCGVAGGVVADRASRRSGRRWGWAISTSWVSRWVSTPTTASTSSASMGTGLVSFRGERVERSAPAWVGVTERHICDGSRPRADRLLIRPTGGPGRCRRPRRTGQTQGHAEAARSVASHVGSPAPSLVVLHPGAPQRHSQIRRDLRACSRSAGVTLTCWDVAQCCAMASAFGVTVRPESGQHRRSEAQLDQQFQKYIASYRVPA